MFDCRSHKRATKIASAALEIPKLSVQLYSGLSAAEKAWADNAKVLDVPGIDKPTGTPVGKVKTKVLLDIKTWVEPAVAEQYKAIEHKSSWVAKAIKAQLAIPQK
jgi:hypothetical protein